MYMPYMVCVTQQKMWNTTGIIKCLMLLCPLLQRVSALQPVCIKLTKLTDMSIVFPLFQQQEPSYSTTPPLPFFPSLHPFPTVFSPPTTCFSFLTPPPSCIITPLWSSAAPHHRCHGNSGTTAAAAAWGRGISTTLCSSHSTQEGLHNLWWIHQTS